VQNRLSDVELHSVAIGGHSGQIEFFFAIRRRKVQASK